MVMVHMDFLFQEEHRLVRFFCILRMDLHCSLLNNYRLEHDLPPSIRHLHHTLQDMDLDNDDYCMTSEMDSQNSKHIQADIQLCRDRQHMAEYMCILVLCYELNIQSFYHKVTDSKDYQI